MKKELAIAVTTLASLALAAGLYAGLNTTLLAELAVLGAVTVSMLLKAERLKETPTKARLSRLVHLAALAVLSGCFLFQAITL